MKNVDFRNVDVRGGFWGFYDALNRTSVVKNVYERFKETGRFDAFKCNWCEGMENKPHIFWDSDVMKWIEGVAYLTERQREPELEAIVDSVVDDVAENQQESGYFNSYFITVEPSEIFKRREDHELYCLGHMIEAAIAYHRATSKDKLLKCAMKYVDFTYRTFVEEGSSDFVTPGHQEIELALLKLYEYTGEEKHLELARFFIDQRGNNDKENNSIHDFVYNQCDMPVREMTEARGHAVRACYLYTAMAMLANIDADEELLGACRRLFDDIYDRKMSITGGIGADHTLENFSYEYNLPNRETYNETCASIGLMLFANAMWETSPDVRYAEVIERNLYNGFVSGLSLDGEKYFYSNPLEVDVKKYEHSTYQTWCERMKSFDCSCCPPNIVRILASVSRFMYSVEGNSIYCNQFANSETELQVGSKRAKLTQITDYPFSGKIEFRYSGEPVDLFVRVPLWCVEYSGEREKGYIHFSLRDGDSVTVELPMNVHFIEADPRVQDNSGRYAVQRGPVVYCMEGIDNGENLRDITLIENSVIETERQEGIFAPVMYLDAERRPQKESLYSLKSSERIPFKAKLIPYFSFANRGITDMIIWTMVK